MDAAINETMTCNTLRQPLRPASDSEDAQHGGPIQSESSSNRTAKLIVLYSQKVLCDGYRIVEGQRRNAVHLSLCDILMEAVHSQAYVRLHFYHTCGVHSTQLDEWCKATGLAIGSRLVTKDAARQVWEFAFSSANYVPTEHANLLDAHVCPVFSRKWMEQQNLDFHQVITLERQRVRRALEHKKARAECEAGKCNNLADADHVWQCHEYDEQRGQSFEDMLANFAIKGLAVFETPRQGNCVAWALHWMKTGQLPEPRYQDDEVEKQRMVGP